MLQSIHTYKNKWEKCENLTKKIYEEKFLKLNLLAERTEALLKIWWKTSSARASWVRVGLQTGAAVRI